MFNAERAYRYYEQALALPEAAARQDMLQKLDTAFLSHLAEEGILPACPKVEVRFDGSGSHVRAGVGLPGNGTIVLGSNDRGHVQGADNQPLPMGDLLDPIWHRWAVLLHEAAHTAFETVIGQAFIPDNFPQAVAQALNIHVFAPFLDNPLRRQFNEAFADAFSALVLLGTCTPSADAEVLQLQAHRRAVRLAYEAHVATGRETDETTAERLIHQGDLALERAFHQPRPMPVAEVLGAALQCASDALVDQWRSQPERMEAMIERSWTDLDPMYAAGRVRRAMAEGVDLGLAWAQACPAHPLVRLWGPLTRQEDGVDFDPITQQIQIHPQWRQKWETIYQRAIPAITHALEEARPHLTLALRPPALAFQSRRLLPRSRPAA